MIFDTDKLEWTRKPKDFLISADKIEIIINPYTDLTNVGLLCTSIVKTGSKVLLNMKTTDFSILEVLLQIMDILIGQLLKLMQV